MPEIVGLAYADASSVTHPNLNEKFAGMWRSQKTREPQKRVEKSVEKQVPSCPTTLRTR